LAALLMDRGQICPPLTALLELQSEIGGASGFIGPRRRRWIRGLKWRQTIADNLSKAGWSWGCVSAIDSNVRTIWIADAHRGDGKRFVVRADELLTALMELESAIRACGK